MARPRIYASKAEADRAHYAKRKEEINARRRAAYAEDKDLREKILAMNKVYRDANKEKVYATDRKWRLANPEKIKANSKRWCENHPDRLASNVRIRQSAKENRTPSWLTKDDEWLMREVYHLARIRTELTGIKWHVDHIFPLRGKHVSGLHVPTNLQVIPAKMNYLASNRNMNKSFFSIGGRHG